jgi:hypothetical protein
MAISELDSLLAEYDEPVRLCGDGYTVTEPYLTVHTINVPDRLRHQSAYSVAQIARKAYLAGVRTTDAEMVAVYLRPSQAERERQERLQNNTQS